jgi:predicted transcriptional regulator
MEIRLSPDQESALRHVAATTGREPEELVQEAVDQLLDYDRWFREQVQIGLAQAERGEFVTHEEVGERIRRLFHS